MLALVAALTLGATPSSAAGATDFYVDKTSPTCSDTGIGTADAPFCTITKGVSKLAAGLTLNIGNGTYAESIKPTVSGIADHHHRLARAQPCSRHRRHLWGLPVGA